MVRLTIDRTHMLSNCEANFEVIQEFSPGNRGERARLGFVKINLAEYVNVDGEDQWIVRRYLLRDSKINSTLNVGVRLKQTDGDTTFVTFVTPVLSRAHINR